MKILFYISFFIVSTSFLSAQNKQDVLSIKEIHEDIDFYFDTLKICNPSLSYRYSERQIDSLRLSLKAECSAPMSIEDFNFLISKSSKFTDLHSGINIEYIIRKPIKDSLFFPVIQLKGMDIYWENRKILNINSKNTKTILSDIDRCISWEYNQQERLYKINKYLTSFLQNVYNILPPYTCQIYTPQKGTHKEIIPTVTWDEFQSKANPSYSKYHKETLDSLFFKDEGIAVLFYNKCDAYTDSTKTYLDRFTQSFFKEVETHNIKQIFIDVSQNGGGTFLSHNYILRFLKSKSYAMTYTHYFSLSQIQEMYNQNLKSAVNKLGLNTEEEIKEFESKTPMFSSMKKRIADGIYNFSQPYTRKGNMNGFEGKVFLITGRTFSAAYDFSEIVKRAEIATTVGEEAGQRMPYGGMGKRGKLPHSGIEFYYSSTFFTVDPSITNTEGFLQPDIPYKLDHPLTLDDYKEIIRISTEDI